MKERMLKNSLLIQNASVLKEASVKRKAARAVYVAQVADEVSRIILYSKSARKSTAKVSDKVLVENKENHSSAQAQIGLLQKLLQLQLTVSQRESVLREISKWSEQISNIRARNALEEKKAK